jgi:hypothetical protein
MKNLFLIISTFSSLLLFSQARVVINNNGFIVIDNSAYLVVDNSNANALTTAGTGGNIRSEDENDAIKWNIGAATGTYTIPWTTNSNIKIPFSMNKTNAGTGAGNVIFATYETATDMNTPWPSTVTHMDNDLIAPVDNSLTVVDRFWRVNANGYTTKPTVSMTFSYDGVTANEIGGSNTLVEANLEAQRWNTGVGDWEALLFGTNDAANDRVTNVNITAADFFDFWILVDRTIPLPVTLLSFNAECKEDAAIINWQTSTEINNDYFVVEKSYDGIVYFELETVVGAGNSNETNSYSVLDKEVNKTTYYRLKQVDFNGTTTYFEVVATNCRANEFEVNQFVFGENQFSFNVITAINETVNVILYDVRGRVVSNKKFNLENGSNNLKLNNLSLSRGMYLLSINGEQNVYSTKLMKQ